MLMPRTRTGVSSQPNVMKLRTVRTAMRMSVRRGLRPIAMCRSLDTGAKYSVAGRGRRVARFGRKSVDRIRVKVAAERGNQSAVSPGSVRATKREPAEPADPPDPRTYR